VDLRGHLDIYNVTNSNSILEVGETYGPVLDQVTGILPGRVFALSLQVDF